jgi:hypothetical protein
MPFVTLLVSLGRPSWIGAKWVAFIMFQLIVEKLLNIE